MRKRPRGRVIAGVAEGTVAALMVTLDSAKADSDDDPVSVRDFEKRNVLRASREESSEDSGDGVIDVMAICRSEIELINKRRNGD